MAGNAGARQTSEKHPQIRAPEVVQHLPHLRLEIGKDPLGQLSIQKPESPQISDPGCNLQDDQPPALPSSSIDSLPSLRPSCPGRRKLGSGSGSKEGTGHRDGENKS